MPGAYVDDVAPDISFQSLPFEDDCHLYVMVPVPPLASVVDVKEEGAAPVQIVSSVPIVSGFTDPFITATTGVLVALTQPVVVLRDCA